MLQHRYLSLFLLLISLNQCALGRKIVLNYSKANLPESQIVKDISYWNTTEGDFDKHKLDLFLPQGKNWPVIVFVHGGEWTSGDKSLKVFGADIYGNIGRYYASQGFGVAVINYRLLPKVDWKNQILDVAIATQWVHKNIQKYSGNPNSIFLVGHSSGAQLVTRVALDPNPLKSIGSNTNIISGIVAVSGAGYNLLDEETYEIAQKEKVFKKLFNQEDISLKLRKQLSPQRYANPKAPPFLILYSENEAKELRDSSLKLHQKLLSVGADSQLIKIPHEGHRKIVVTLSNPRKMSAAILAVFIKSVSYCSQ